MMLHIGEEVVIPYNKIIAIFDINILNDNAVNKEFFQTAEDEGFIKKISNKVKSFVITTENNMFLSPISSITLKARFDKKYSIDIGR